MTFSRSLLLSSRRRVMHLLLSLALMSTTARAASKYDYRDLLIFLNLNGNGNYSRDIRPSEDYFDTTDVYLTFILHSFIDVNEQDQTLTTSSELFISWKDYYLQWYPEDFANISSILMRQERLWLPDIVVENTVSSQKQLGHKELPLRIDYEGLVEWNPSGVFETTCEMDITYFPFDTQACDVVFVTEMSRKYEVSVAISKEEPMDISHFSPDGLWELGRYSAENSEAEDSKTKITFKLQLKRRWSYYVLNIILPILFLSMTSSLTFALPSNAGEKMGLSITVLLAYAVYLTLIADTLPRTSMKVSVVTVYLVVLLAVSATSVILTAAILTVHHREGPVTGCMVRFIVFLRAITCMKKLQSSDRERVYECKHDEEGEQQREAGTKSASPTDVTISGSRMKKDGAVKTLSGKEVGKTLDRCTFLLFTFIVLGSTIACLVALLIGSRQQRIDTATASDEDYYYDEE